MKLTALISLVACLHVSAGGYSQTISLSVKNAHLDQVFTAIQNQSGYNFFFNYSQLDKANKVTLDIKDAPLEQVLQICFKDQPLIYSIVNKTIVVKEKVQPIPGVSPSLFIDIHGRVLDENGKPVAGVSVFVKGSPKGTVTDSNGEFALKTTASDAILVFSSINMQSFELKVDGKTELAVSLKTKISELGKAEIVYSTGYQNVSKEQAVGAYSKLDSAAYSQRAGINILDRLDGTLTGVFFDKTGGTAPLQIRGISTLGGGPSFNPLIIVDNFPFTGDLSNINANDVKDITILKDAAAASIWGAAAGNGVIVITTKKGRYNHPFQISASSNIAITQKPNLFYYPQMSSSDFIDVEKFLFDHSYYNNNLAYPAYYITSPVVDLLDQQRNGIISADEATSQINQLRTQDIRNDYDKYVYRKAVAQQHFVNFSGGTQIINYNCAVGYNKTIPNIQGGKSSDQITINTSTTFRPLKNLEFSIGADLNRSVNKDASFPYPISPGSYSGYTQLYPYARLADANGNHLAIAKDYGMAFVDTAGAGQLLDWHYRPLDEIELEDNITTTQFARINFAASYRFAPWLKASFNYVYSTQIDANKNYQSPLTYSTRNYINQFTQSDGVNLTYPVPLGGILDIANHQISSHNLRGQLDFNKKWQGKHDFSGLIAGELSQNSSSSNTNRFYGYNSDNQSFTTNLDYSTYLNFYDGAGPGSGQIYQNSSTSDGSFNRFVSLLANASYTYDSRISFYASGRRDGSNVFGVNTNNKWKPLWSVGSNWEVSKESFFKSQWVSSLHLRVAYGHMGNVANTLSGVPTIFYGNSLPFTRLTVASIGNAPNPDLRWEDVSTTNIGIDFGLLQNRLSGSVEVFQKNSKDLISLIPFDPTAGVDKYTVNAASMKGKGVELNIHSRNIIRAFTWVTDFGLTYDKTVVTKYTNGGFNLNLTGLLTGYGINPFPGKLAWGVYSYKWAGLDPLTGDPKGFFNKQISKDYPSILHDSIQNQVFNGSSLPLYVGFLSNTFSWRNISLSLNITYRLDFYFRRPTLRYSSLFNNWIGNADYSKRWQKPGDEKNTSVPSLDYPANSNRDDFYAQSSVNVLRGDNIRLQFARLAYDWNAPVGAKFPAKSAQLFCYANNLNMILWRANKSAIDPDFTGSSIVPPTSKTFTVGCSLNF